MQGKMRSNHKQTSLIGMLVCLTLVLIAIQAIFFFIHYKVGDIADSLANASIFRQLFHPIILFCLSAGLFLFNFWHMDYLLYGYGLWLFRWGNYSS